MICPYCERTITGSGSLRSKRITISGRTVLLLACRSCDKLISGSLVERD